MTNKNTPQAGKLASALIESRTTPPHRILIVVDDPYSCHLCAEALIQQGYEVNAAENGEAGWEELQADSYNLLITEYDIPKVSGVELLKKLRAARMALPVIMAARAVPKTEFTRFPWLQTAGTLLKPFTADELLASVRKVLRPPSDTRDDSNPRSSIWSLDRPNESARRSF